MKLVTGGAFQGKLAYAEERYGVRDGWVDGRSCALSEIKTCRGIYAFHEYVRRWLEQERAAFEDEPNKRKADGEAFPQGDSEGWELSVDARAEAFARMLFQENPEMVVVTDELGCGIVPMDPADREYRETVGRICTCLAARSEEVVRVICGVGMVLKETCHKS